MLKKAHENSPQLMIKTDQKLTFVNRKSSFLAYF
jgi:hypothetical protein